MPKPGPERYSCPDCNRSFPRNQFRDHPAECPETVTFKISHFIEPVHSEQVEQEVIQGNLETFEGENVHSFQLFPPEEKNDYIKSERKSKQSDTGNRYHTIRKDGNEFTCTICDTKKATRNHAKRHTDSYHIIFPCNECGTKLPWKCENCSNHPNRVCHICLKFFRDSYDLKSHLKIHNDGKELELISTSKEIIPSVVSKPKVKIKTKKVASETTNLSRKDKKKRERPYRHTLKRKGNLFLCTVCDSTHETRKMGQKHVNNNHRDFSCSKCGQLFPWKCENCSQHAKRACYICPKMFIDSNHLSIHLNMHLGLKPFLCDQCSSSFKSKVGLNLHIKFKHSSLEFDCKECGKSFSASYVTCANHKMLKSEVDIPCEKGCGYTTRYKERLKHHYLSPRCDPKNPLLRIFFCRFCEGSFTTEKYKRRHERFHSEPKPYNCRICGLTFTQSYNMKRHTKRIHAQITGT